LLFLRNLSGAARTALSDRDDSEESSKDDSDSDNERLADECRLKQRKISVELWDGVDKEVVERLPDDIDGDKVYEIKGQLDKKKLVAALKDGRKWKKNCPTTWRGHARVRYADCKGSFKCTRNDCPFRVQYGVINTTQFEKKKTGEEFHCKGCGLMAEFVPCSARRYISYGKKSAKVYHCGQHTCPVIKAPVKNTDQVHQILKDNPNIKPAELQSACILSTIRQQCDWRDVEKQAEATLDKQWISNEKKKLKKDIEPVGHNFEAVVTFKQYCDEKDEFYVYKVNDRRGNPDKPSFVFKSSREKAKIALNMNRNGSHYLNSEFCYFDGKYKRCCGFVTLTASVYHSLLRKQIILGTMEAESENSQNVALFWELFNEILKKVSGSENETFNPIGWCTDLAGANLAGLCAVFGESTKSRIKTCEFHFKDHRNKKANRLDSQSGEEFKSLCNELLESVSEKHYDTVKKRLDSFIAAKEERSFLQSWLSWWHDRRGFIFRAFAPKNGPRMNQAEVIHAGWGHRDNPNMSLLEVCQADVRDSLLLDAELRGYAAGTATGGDGPSFLQSKKREYARELNKARKMGEELLQSDAEGLTIDPAASFRPTERKKRTQEATRKDKVNRPKQTAATGTFAVTDKRDRPSHTTASSSSHVPAPDLVFKL